MLLQEVLQREAVHDGAEHAHVVGPGAVHAALGELGAPEEVAAADHDGHLDAVACHPGDLASHGRHDVRVDAHSATAEDLTGELQHHPAVAPRLR
jgi:hypothetical protein